MKGSKINRLPGSRGRVIMKSLVNIPVFLLVFVLLLTACGTSNVEPVSTTKAGTSSQPTEKEIVDFDWTILGDGAVTAGFEKMKDGLLWKELEEKNNVRLTLTGADEQKKQVIVASGDTTDIITIMNQSEISNMIKGGLLLPLNDLINQYGPNIQNIRPERLKMAQSLLSDGSGEAYVLPVNAGSEGRAGKESQSIYMLRWDYYKEMNYPKITNPDDMLKVLADMQKLHPQTPDGKPVYGVGFYNTANSTKPFEQRFWHTYGFRATSNSNVLIRVSDHKMIFNYTDPEGPFWMAAEYYNKANRLGLLDPDSLIQKLDDYQAKVENGQMLTCWIITYGAKLEDSALSKDPKTIIGYETPPVEGVTLWADSVQAAGWENNYIAIPKTCKNPERAMELINYLFGYEGTRLIKSGVQGVHWDIINGVPQPTKDAIQLKIKGGDEWATTGIGAVMGYLAGLGNDEVAPDGGKMNLFRSEFYYRATNKPVDEDYCTHYNVTYPMEAFKKYIDEGKILTHKNLDLRVVSGLGSAPDDIKRIDTKLLDIAVKAIPKTVLAKSEEEFEQIKAQTIDEFKAAGSDTSKDWWQKRYDEVSAYFSK